MTRYQRVRWTGYHNQRRQDCCLIGLALVLALVLSVVIGRL